MVFIVVGRDHKGEWVIARPPGPAASLWAAHIHCSSGLGPESAIVALKRVQAVVDLPSKFLIENMFCG